MSGEFIDTNVLIYAHDGGAGVKHHEAARLVTRLSEDGGGSLSIQVLSEFYAIATQKLGRKSEEVEQIIRDLNAWRIHSPVHADLLRAASLHRGYKTNWWDALIINSAIQLECSILWSEDLNHGKRYQTVRCAIHFYSAKSAHCRKKEDRLLVSGGCMRSVSVVFPSVLALLISLPLAAQEVVSAYSGTVHFFEGVVLLDEHPLEHKAATFPAINEGSTLRTEKGRAEVLLTPNVFLRLDENSAIRMVSHALTDTQIEFLHGSAILDSAEAPAGPPIVLMYQHHRARFPKPGIYRIDSDTGVLQAYSGQARVESPEGKTSSVDRAKLYFFDLGTITNKFGEPNEDEFYDWARGRADAIAAQNQLASQESADGADADPGAGVFNAPLPSYGASPSQIYPSLVPYQFGTEYFNPFFGLNAGGFGVYNVFPIYVLLPRRPGTSHWPHSGITAGSGYVASRPGLISNPIRIPVYTPRPIYTPSGAGRVYHPAAPAPHPVAPIAIHH